MGDNYLARSGARLDGLVDAVFTRLLSQSAPHAYSSPRPARPPGKVPVCPNLERPLPVPRNWDVISLDSATDPQRPIRYGILMPRASGEGQVPYVEVKDLVGNTLVGKQLRRTTRELDEQYAGARLVPGDVVIAIRGSYERTAVVPEELNKANISRDVARVTPREGVDSYYLRYWLQSRYVRSYLHRHARGVAVKGVNIATLRALPVALPALDHQQRIVAQLQDLERTRARLRLQIETARYRQRLLRRQLFDQVLLGQLALRDSRV